jgi:hypothetical protein
VNRCLGADVTAGKLDGTVRYYLVGVHIRLGSRARLPHNKRKVVVEIACDDLVRGARDQLCFLSGKLAELGVRQRRRLL